MTAERKPPEDEIEGGLETSGERRGSERAPSYPHDYRSLPDMSGVPVGGRAFVLIGSGLILAGLVCLVYLLVSGLPDFEFDTMPWLPLGVGLVVGGVVCLVISAFLLRRW
jgi:hypothetical protein